MKKTENEHGQLVLVRDKWMQQIMNATYVSMIKVAIVSPAGINGAWECAISDHLKWLWKNRIDRHIIQGLLTESGVHGLTAHAFDKCAELIVKSKIPTNE